MFDELDYNDVVESAQEGLQDFFRALDVGLKGAWYTAVLYWCCLNPLQPSTWMVGFAITKGHLAYPLLQPYPYVKAFYDLLVWLARMLVLVELIGSMLWVLYLRSISAPPPK